MNQDRITGTINKSECIHITQDEAKGINESLASFCLKNKIAFQKHFTGYHPWKRYPFYDGIWIYKRDASRFQQAYKTLEEQRRKEKDEESRRCKNRKRRESYTKNKIARIRDMPSDKRPLFAPVETESPFGIVEYPLGAYCPLCGSYFSPSGYLTYQTKWTKKLKWLANVITHSRHYHNRAYDDKWQTHGAPVSPDYDEEHRMAKHEANESAKMQLIHKATAYLVYHKIGLKEFRSLQETTEETLNEVKKRLK